MLGSRRARRLTAAVGLALGVTAGGQTAAAAADQPAQPAQTKLPVGEVPERRTATSRTVRNDDGTLTTTAHLQPVHYRGRNGEWKPIDSSLVAAGTPGFAYRNKANSYGVSFRPTTASDFMRLSTDGGEVGVKLLHAAPARASVEKARITYERPLTSTDLRYDVTAAAVKETLVLHDRMAPSTFRFRLESIDGTALHAEPADGGGWEVWSTKSSLPLFVLDPSWAAEAGPDGEAGPEGDPHANTTVEPAGGGLDVTLQVDRAWLYAPERAFPVLVDPTITLQTPTLDASLDASCPTCTADYSRGLHSIGSTTTAPWRAAMKFDLADLPGSANLASANLELFFHDACILGGCDTPHTVTAHRVTGAWASGSPSSAFTHDATPLASVTSPTADFAWLAWNVTQTVRDWVDGQSDNNGFLLRKTDETLGSDGLSLPARRYREPTLAPRLVVTYSGEGVDLLRPHTLHADGAELEWTKYAGAPANFQKYEVHRSAVTPFTPTTSTLLSVIRDINVTEYRDTTAAPSKAFAYKVVANDSPSNPRTVALPADGKSTKTLQGPDLVSDTFMSKRSTYTDCGNFGAYERLEVDATTDKLRRGLLRVDLRDVPQNSTVESAVLSLWHPYTFTTNEAIRLHRVTRDWEEGTGTGQCTKDGATWYDPKGGVKWSSDGADFHATAAASLSWNAGQTARWHDFAITPLVTEWLTGASPNHGVVLKLADETPRNLRLVYWGSEHTMTPTVQPKLVLTYADGSRAKGPDVLVTSPAAGATVRGPSVAMSASAVDDRRVDSVEFYVDNAKIATDWVHPFGIQWDSNAVANGSHTLTAKAYDDAGNATTSAPVAFTVDNTAPPTVAVSASTAGSYASAVQADSPRGFWRLNETTGASAADGSAYAHAGTYRGTASVNVPGALAHDLSIAARFPGADASDVAVPDAAHLDFGTGDFTAEAWVKTVKNGERVIMGKFSGVGNSRNWRVSVTDDAAPWTGRVRVSMHDGTTGVNAYGPSTRVDDGKWHHVAVAFSRAAGITVYVDGVGRTTAGTPAGSVDNAEPLRIGDTEAYSAFEGDIDEAAVYATALSESRVRAHHDAGVIRGAHTVTAAAADDVGVAKVEFFADGVRVGEDSAAPYTATVDTLAAATPLYDGPRTFTAKAYDGGGQSTTSEGVVRTVGNGGYSKYRAAMTSTAVPPVVTYDPALSQQEQAGVDVTVTNTSTYTWPAADVKLRYRWISTDATPVYTDSAPVALPADLADGASATLRLLIEPPVLPEGVDRASYRLRFDLYDYGASAWFAGKGNLPLENPIVVNKVVTAGLGLERFWQYEGESVGMGVDTLTNVASGNMLLRWTPFASPGRGLSTVVGLTYNSLERGGGSPVGNNFSLSVSSLTRLGSRLDVHPNNADSIAGRSNKWVQLTDGDGTTFRFDGANAADGSTYWKEPAGVHLYLREFSPTDATKKWALTRPDRVTFFYDADGYPTGVEDANGNRLHFTLSDIDPGDDPGGPRRRVTAVTDAAGNASPAAPSRAYAIDYFTADEVKKAQQRGKVQRISDHDGSALDFEYYEDGNLLRLTQRAAPNEPAQQRSVTFTYTTSAGDGPAIPNAADRADPDPRTSPQSSRLYSVRDPRGHETTFAYYGPGSPQKRWRLLSRTNREGSVTSFAYTLTSRIATVTAPMSRVTTFAYDTEGKATSITNPKNEKTKVEWTADRMVSKVTEPTGHYTEFAYNDNGYLTDSWDQLRNRTQLEYTHTAVDAGDVAEKWRTGRTIPHASQLAKKTDPKGTATATPTDDFQWEFSYNAAGNLTSVADPENKVTAYTRNADGTIWKATDPNGNVTTFDYDDNGLAKTVVDAVTGLTQFKRSADGLLLWAQDANHASYTSSGDDAPDNQKHRAYTYYDGFQRPVRSSTPEAGAEGRLVWSGVALDDNDNVVEEFAPAFAPEFNSQTFGPRTTFTYDDMDRPELVTGPDKTEDPLGERTLIVYDAAGRVAKQTSPRGVRSPTADDFTVFNDYDALDRVTRQYQYEFLPDGTTNMVASHACYDLAGDLVRVAAPLAGDTYDCNAPTPTHTTRFTYDNAHRRLSTTDPEGRLTAVEYDENGNVKTSTDVAGSVTTIGYDQRDLPVKVVEPFVTGTLPRSLTSRIEYDNVGNRKRIISPRAWDASVDKETFTQYVTTIQYDALNRVSRVDLPTSTVDSQQLYVHRAYDGVGNLTVSSLPVTAPTMGGVAAADKTTVRYFDTGWVRSTAIGDRPAVSYTYKPNGLQESRTAPKSGGGEKREFWDYFDDGMLKAYTDAKDARSEFWYNEDNLLRLATQRRANTNDPAKELEASYDTLNRNSKVRSRAPGASTWVFGTTKYDDNGNVRVREHDGKEGGTAAAPRVVEFTYDQADWLKTTTNLGVTSPSNDPADDQLVESDFWGQGWERERRYKTRESGSYVLRQQTNWEYFANGKLKTVATKNGAGAELESHTVGYFDPANVYVNGNRTSDAFKLQGPDPTAPCRLAACNVTYTYDAKDRLVSTSDGRGKTTSYTLTPSGSVDLEQVNGVTAADYTYTGGLLDTLTAGGRTERYFHDADGNLECVTLDLVGSPSGRADCGTTTGQPNSDRLVKQVTYNYVNQVEAYESFTTTGTGTPAAKDSSAYEHDALDRVVKQVEKHGTSAATTIDFSYVGLSDQLASEVHAGARSKTLTYAYDAYGHRLTMHDTRGTNTQKYSYGYDVHGNTSLLVNQEDGQDAAGTVKAAYGYTAYGAADTGLTKGDPESDDPTNFMRYSARRWDPGSKTLDMGARRYDSGASRFLQFDQYNGALADLGLSTDPLTGNRYALAGGNPVGYREWDGHFSVPDGSAGALDVGSVQSVGPAVEHRQPESVVRAPAEVQERSSAEDVNYLTNPFGLTQGVPPDVRFDNIMRNLYNPRAMLGDGSTADALKVEIERGVRWRSESGHYMKAKESLEGLKRLQSRGGLSADRLTRLELEIQKLQQATEAAEAAAGKSGLPPEEYFRRLPRVNELAELERTSRSHPEPSTKPRPPGAGSGGGARSGGGLGGLVQGLNNIFTTFPIFLYNEDLLCGDIGCGSSSWTV